MRNILWMVIVLMATGCEQLEEVSLPQHKDTKMIKSNMNPMMQKQEARGVAEPEAIVISPKETTIEDLRNLLVEDATQPTQSEVIRSEKIIEAVESSVTAPSPSFVMTNDQDTSIKPLSAIMGDALKGAKLAKGKCASCHYLDKDRKKLGPSLKGVYGKAPSIDGVPFEIWDAEALDAWIANPKAIKKKTKMSFKGIKDAQKRLDLISYLRSL